MSAQTEQPLPPQDATQLRLLGVPGTVVRRYDVADVVVDAVATLAPDAILAVPPHANLATQRLMHATDTAVYTPHRGTRRRTLTRGTGAGEVAVVVAPSPEQVPDTPAAVVDGKDGADTTGGYGYLVSDALSLRVDPHERTTVIEGLTDYADAVSESWLDGVVHLSTDLRAGFTTTTAVSTGDAAARLRVAGVGTPARGLGAAVDGTNQEIAVVDCYPNGAVVTETVAPDGFGLRGLAQVGASRAERLREAGLTDVTAVSRSDPTTLSRIADIGQATARTVAASAEAVADGAVVRTSDATLPDADPIYIDIETDGLAASVAWLVGVLDGDAETGPYYPFRQRTPAAPADHLDAFLTWLAGTDPARPVVAWNGYGFDFDILTEQVREHHPARAEVWVDRRKFDPLYWARQDNAALPGRTNKLEHVAAALGRDGATTGIDGETAASRYVAWRDRMEQAEDPATVRAPDWDRLEAYCEDDVRALATVYEAIAAAPRTRAEERTDRTQGALSDFG